MVRSWSGKRSERGARSRPSLRCACSVCGTFAIRGGDDVGMPPDPRVFFASERTLLAWIRTGIAIVGLGFVVSRFGLFLRVLHVQLDPKGGFTGGHVPSNLFGIALVLLGSISMASAAIQHGRFVSTLPESDRPARYSPTWALWISGMLTTASVLLAAYLLLTGRGAA